MDKIELGDINLLSLRKLQNQGTLSTIYTDGELCYKILDGLHRNEKQDLYKKFLDMAEINIDNVLLPKDLLVEDGLLKGYTMEYFRDSIPLSNKFSTRYFNCKDLFTYVNKASKVLREIHSHGIICQDLSFENILVNREGNIAFCDMDGCRYKDHNSPFISVILKEFLFDYRKSKIFVEEDVDKISMILSLYLLMFDQVLQKITRRQYRSLSNHIHTLENLKQCANMLVDKKCIIRDVPYLDEVIDLADDYEVDRKRILTLRQKILAKLPNRK